MIRRGAAIERKGPWGHLPPLYAEEAAALHAAAFAGLEQPYGAEDLARMVDGHIGFLIGAHEHVPALPPQIAAPLSGFVLYRVAGGEAEIIVIAVAPVDQRQGYGAFLLAAAEADAAERGASRMVLEVAEGNVPARALYARAGYAPAGRRKGYYRRPGGNREDALLLARDLAAGTAD